MRNRRALLAFLGALMWIAAVPPSALAHAGFVSSNPEPGATLSTAPGQVLLRFTEPLNEELSRANLIAPDGSSASGKVTGDDEMQIDLTTNQPGVYEVRWTTVSTLDGHTLSGEFRFGVGVSPGIGAEGGTTAEPGGRDLLVVVARIVEDVSLLLVVGLLLLGRLARREPPLRWARTPTFAAFVAAFLGGLAVIIGEAAIAASSLSTSGVTAYLTAGLPGWSRLARVILEGLGILAAWRWPRVQAPLVAAAIVALAAAGHAAAIQPRVWGVTVEAVHLLSAGLWAGGIIGLAFQRPPEGWLGREGRTLLDRFTPVALGAFAVTVGTGVIRGIQEVGGFGSLFGSSYGIALVIKALLVLVVVQFSLLAWRRIAVLPRGEAVSALLVVAVAALLSAYPLPPAREGEAAEEAQPSASSGAPIPEGESVTLGDHAGPVLVGLTLAPGAPGSNDLVVFVQSLDGPEATAALPVEVTVDGDSVSLTSCADTCRRGSAELDGGELITVAVTTDTGGRASFRVPDLPVASGETLLQEMTSTMGSLDSFRLDEELTSGLGTTVHASYSFSAPNSFESHVVQDGDTFSTVWIDETRYTKGADGGWKVEQGVPAVPVPTYVWGSFAPYSSPAIVGSARVDGVPTRILAFAGGGDELPAWFRLWVDVDGFVHRAEMRAPGHFMDHRYFDFDEPIVIEPPSVEPSPAS